MTRYPASSLSLSLFLSLARSSSRRLACMHARTHAPLSPSLFWPEQDDRGRKQAKLAMLEFNQSLSQSRYSQSCISQRFVRTHAICTPRSLYTCTTDCLPGEKTPCCKKSLNRTDHFFRKFGRMYVCTDNRCVTQKNKKID